jgi:hypothetical protein
MDDCSSKMRSEKHSRAKRAGSGIVGVKEDGIDDDDATAAVVACFRSSTSSRSFALFTLEWKII